MFKLTRTKISSDFVFLFICLAIAVLLGCVCISIFAIFLKVDNRITVLTTLLMVAAATYMAGNLIGLLFGIPRILQERSERRSGPQHQTNTNLEQISDWLTKILIGVGLVELNNIVTAINEFASKVSEDIEAPGSESIILASIIYFFIVGFLVTYLGTRLFIAGALASADIQLSNISSKKDAEDAEEN